MKKILFLILILIYLTSCSTSNKLENQGQLSEKEIKKIAFISDTHLQIDNNSDGVSYINSINTELIKATLSDVENEGVDLLILCGDNTNSGRKAQHEALKELLDGVDKNIDILFLAGNHDLGEVDKQQIPLEYQDYGYGKAFSKDDKSLSYCLIYNDLMIIFLDTNNEDKWEIGYPKFQEETLTWLKNQLNYGFENDKSIICLGHYPLITRQGEDFKQQAEILNLFKQYNVQLYISGHLHYHAVSEKEGIKEVVISQTTSYPLIYEIMEIKDEEYILYPKKVDVEKWASENKINDEKLLSFNEYLDAQYKKKCEDIINSLIEDKDIADQDLQKAQDLFTKVMMYRSDGTLIEHIDEITSHDGYPIFQEISEGTIWKRWIPLVISEANKDTMGFVVKRAGK